MARIYPLIDDEPPSKRDTVFIRILVWLVDLYNTIFYRTHVPVFDFLCSVYLYRSKKGYKLRWIIRIPAYFCILVLIGVSILTPLMVREMVISVAPWTYVRTAHAAEVKPVKQAKTYTIPQIVDAVHILESSGGVKDGCIAKGKINGFGFAQTGDGKTWDCFKNYKEVRTRVEQWYTEKLKTMTLAQALCYYNLGKPKGVLLNDCPYYQNFLKVVES